ncbi:PHD finger protein 14 isoform X2 [Phlebotomus argentipes]|uniref:PHD finger protein 14 isoform X2 n=1 Tax=Phlebotomus argentipes TaxID=94469 RepID=UPI00289329B7|nr:PHD finger protein 14 isoform X2 [Phlebotomus argentipes]
MMKKRATGLTTQTLLDFDLGESSSDSDFRIEDHDEESDDYSENSGGEQVAENNEDSDSDSEDGSESGSSETKYDLNEHPKDGILSVNHLLNQVKSKQEKIDPKLLSTPICCACLGDRSDDANEIVECDGCGVTVHEGCYGVNDTASLSSTVSSCSTEPWFCEACKAGAQDPPCELCPNKGGIFKETDVGKWVHLICALYVPGVAFGEVDQLTSVTLFEMPYSKWGAKTCSICEDARFARTGVCIGCDAGMCKTYFHVTCAQSAGLLSEAHSEEADHADPFYAHCKIHSDKTLLKHRRRNFHAMRLRMEHRRLETEQKRAEKPTPEQQRIDRKLKKHKNKYLANKAIKTEPWVPTQKMPRMLATSASACRRLMIKAQLMGIDAEALEFQEAQMMALADVRKKWHIAPAFSVEFIGYYLDRITRLRDLKINLQEQLESNRRLLDEQKHLREKYDQMMKLSEELSKSNTQLRESITKLHGIVTKLCPNKSLVSIENIGKPVVNVAAATPPAGRPMSVPTAAALKMGVGFPLINLPGTKNDSGKILSTQRQNNDELLHECGICKRCNDQHLLAKCDTCHFYYHLGCLNPPLTRHPKKCKLYGWQCSECDRSDDSDAGTSLPKRQRKSRARYSKDGIIVEESDPPEVAVIENKNGPKPMKIADRRMSIAKRMSGGDQKLEDASLPVVQIEDIMKAVPRKRGRKKKILSINNTFPPLYPVVQQNNISVQNTNAKDQVNSAPVTQLSSPPKITVQSPPKITVQSPPKITVQSPPKISVQSPRTLSPEKNKSEKRKAKKEKRNHLNFATDAAAQYYIEKVPDSGKNHSADVASSSEKSEDPQDNAEVKTSQNAVESQQDGDAASKIEKDLSKFNHKQNRKKRKEKHKNKHSELERLANKEHKRKRKRKYNLENNTSDAAPNANDPHPPIKIKLKVIPCPSGQANSEAQIIYVPSNSNPEPVCRPMEICHTPKAGTPVDLPNHPESQRNTSPQFSPKMARISSPRRKRQRTPSLNLSAGSAENSRNSASQMCDVCCQLGTTQNLVMCDECRKNYHFTCLEPPLKKTPKRRGYSWHCADCDPTDIETI